MVLSSTSIVKALTVGGSITLGAGILSTVVSACTVSELPVTYTSSDGTVCTLNTGGLHEHITPVMYRVAKVLQFYPSVQSEYTKLCEYVERFTHHFFEKRSRPMVKVQRKVFKLVDTVRIKLSESTALEDLYRCTDELKQLLTELCLHIDH